MGGPNGAAFDAKNNKIFISEVNKRKVNVYDISKVSDSLFRRCLKKEKLSVRSWLFWYHFSSSENGRTMISK